MKEKDENIKVKMVYPEDPTQATRVYNQEIRNFSRLGRKITISPKANVTVNKPGFKSHWYVETVSVLIGIGKDHTAEMIMDVDAWNALRDGEEITVTTTKQFKKMYGG